MAAIARETWQVLSPLLDELFEADEAHCAARLREIRARDPALADLVQRMLAERSVVEREGFLGGSAVETADLPHGPLLEPLAGTTLGGYTIERTLGHGGMSAVWLASRSDGRYEGKAAIKFLSLPLLAGAGAQRFRREGSALARVSHPNIARLLDAGLTPAGQPYLVLEYVDGAEIDRYCDMHRLDVRARIELFLQVLSAVAHAHASLVLHRDLKPSNILVDAAGQAKLLDFGIARLMDDSDADAAAQVTRAFTPDYAAPEQVEGGAVTTATDVYALGVILHALLTGAHPTAKPGAERGERLRALVDAEPARASEAAARAGKAVAAARRSTPAELARTLRGDLDNILAKALRKEPAGRYHTVDAFAQDLRRYLVDEPVEARPDSLGYRAGKWIRRHRVLVGAAATVALALVVGVAGTTWQAIEARRAAERAEANEREANRQRRLAEFEARVALANHEFLSQVFGDAMRGGESEAMHRRLERARSMLRRRYADDPQVHAILLLQVAGRYAELGDQPREAEVMKDIEALAERSGDRALQSAVECIRAYDLIVGGKLDAAAPLVARGLALLERAVDAPPTSAFECLRADAMLAALRKDSAHAARRMNELLERLERGGRGQSRAYTSALGSLAYIHRLAEEPAEALAVTRRAIELHRRLGDTATLGAAIEVEREAYLLVELGRLADARVAEEEFQRRFAETGEAMPSRLSHNAARRALAAGRTESALHTLQALVARAAKQPSGPSLQLVLLDLADALRQSGRVAEAAATLRRYERSAARGPGDAYEAIELARVRAQVALAAGDRGRAARLAQALAATINEQSKARRHVQMRGRLAAGEVLARTGDLDSARRELALALQLAEAASLKDRPSAWVGAVLMQRAFVERAAGDMQSAEKTEQAAQRMLADSVDAAHPMFATAASR